MAENLCDLEPGKDCFGHKKHTLWAKKVGKMGFIKIKNICSLKTTAEELNDKPQTRRKEFQNMYLIKS